MHLGSLISGSFKGADFKMYNTFLALNPRCFLDTSQEQSGLSSDTSKTGQATILLFF